MDDMARVFAEMCMLESLDALHPGRQGPSGFGFEPGMPPPHRHRARHGMEAPQQFGRPPHMHGMGGGMGPSSFGPAANMGGGGVRSQFGPDMAGMGIHGMPPRPPHQRRGGMGGPSMYGLDPHGIPTSADGSGFVEELPEDGSAARPHMTGMDGRPPRRRDMPPGMPPGMSPGMPRVMGDMASDMDVPPGMGMGPDIGARMGMPPGMGMGPDMGPDREASMEPRMGMPPGMNPRMGMPLIPPGRRSRHSPMTMPPHIGRSPYDIRDDLLRDELPMPRRPPHHQRDEFMPMGSGPPSRGGPPMPPFPFEPPRPSRRGLERMMFAEMAHHGPSGHVNEFHFQGPDGAHWHYRNGSVSRGRRSRGPPQGHHRGHRRHHRRSSSSSSDSEREFPAFSPTMEMHPPPRRCRFPFF